MAVLQNLRTYWLVSKDHPLAKHLISKGIKLPAAPAAHAAAAPHKSAPAKQNLLNNLNADVASANALVNQGGNLLDNLTGGGGDDSVGKIKLKIQPGKLLKKFGGAAPRNAFLALLKINFLDMAKKLNDKAYVNPGNKKKLEDFWRKAGGNTNKLHTAVHGGVNTYNKLHKKHTAMNGMIADDNMDTLDYTMGGMDSMYDMGDYMSMGFVKEDMRDTCVGFAPAAIPALLAAATPIIIAGEKMLKSFGINTAQLKSKAAASDADVAAAHNDAVDDGSAGDDGTVDHGSGVTTKAGKDANGDQTMDINADDTTGSDTGDDGGDDGAQKGVTKANGVMSNLFSDAKEWVVSHKGAIIGTVVAVTTVVIIYKIATRKKKGRGRKK